ncbi:MAG TPA: bifunctional riboflavin kinase/FAD synthetase [Acidimicrobiales bacterium]|nr:bifunctional riboflavin kinase/FAD synthetase [Acidimicrobiales bacterium]
MEVLSDGEPCPQLGRGSVITIGAYDGVHLGHRAIIAEVRNRARAQGAASVVVTFDRHPARVVRPESAPLQLTDLDQKLELLAMTGVDYTMVVRFDQVRAAESAEDFVSELLVGCLNARGVVVGHDFHFGRGRGGNVALLSDMGRRLGFDVVGLRLVSDPEAAEVVSSTRIRGLLGAGAVEEAARLLGRPHEVRGVVEKGDGRAGPELGFPTANVAVPADIQLPADGIYAGWYRRPEGSVLPAALSLGLRPTFYPEGGPRLLEAHLLDFSGRLYGEVARVSFSHRLRDEEHFDTAEALVDQMARDVAAVRELITLRGEPTGSA